VQKEFLEIRTAIGPEGRFVGTVSGEATEQQLTSESQQQTAIKHYAECRVLHDFRCICRWN